MSVFEGGGRQEQINQWARGDPGMMRRSRHFVAFSIAYVDVLCVVDEPKEKKKENFLILPSCSQGGQ